MAAIGFYHLTRTGAPEALAPLLGRTLESGARAVVRCGDAEKVAALDAALWRIPEPVWLPHGTPAGDHAALQPIWLTAGTEVPNGARFLFLLDDRDADDLDRFERVFLLFDGTAPDSLAAARQRWTRYRGEGHEVVYWRQDATRWVRGA